MSDDDTETRWGGLSQSTKCLFNLGCSFAFSLLLAHRAGPALAGPYDNSIKSRVALAQHLIDRGHVLDARRVILPLCHKPNTTAQMYAVLAESYVNDPEQDPKMNGEILADLKMAMKLDPEYGQTYYVMSQYCNVQAQYQDALKYEEKALKAKKPEIGAMKLMTGTYSSMGRYQDALNTISEFMRKCGPTDRTYTTQASLLEQLKRYDEAAAAYRLSLAERNQDTTVFQLARCLDKAGKYQEAIDAMTKLLKTNTDDGEAFALRARLAVKNKNPKMALEDFTQAIELEPTAKLYGERAAVYTQLGQAAAAAKDLARSKEIQNHPF